MSCASGFFRPKFAISGRPSLDRLDPARGGPLDRAAPRGNGPSGRATTGNGTTFGLNKEILQALIDERHRDNVCAGVVGHGHVVGCSAGSAWVVIDSSESFGSAEVPERPTVIGQGIEATGSVITEWALHYVLRFVPDIHARRILGTGSS